MAWSTHSGWLLGLYWVVLGCATVEDPASLSAGGTVDVQGGTSATSGGASGRVSSGGSNRGGMSSAGGALGGGGSSGGLTGVAGSTTHPFPVGPLDVVFTPSPGTFVSSQSITLTVESKMAKVHYTLDGSVPSQASPVYSEPLALQRSTRIRAIAIEPASGGSGNATSGPPAAATYLRVASDAAAFASHLPIILIDTFRSEELDPEGVDFVPAALQVFEPVGGSTTIVGPATLDTRIGIHVRGESSRGFLKKQYAVEFWAPGADEDINRPLLGMPADSDWVVQDSLTMDRTSIRNAFVYALTNRLGRYAPRTRFVEVYMTRGEADVNAESFLGLFTVVEKIKRGAERVNVSKLNSQDLTEPNITGGYVLRIDPGPYAFKAGGRGVQWVYPDSDQMMLAERLPQTQYIQTYIDKFYEASKAPDHKHPMTGEHYSEFIDQDSFIDLHIISNLTRNPDSIRRSLYFYKEKSQKLAAGPVWDFDRTLGTPNDERATEPQGWVSFEEGWWQPLFEDPAFRAKYRTRFLELLQTQFTQQVFDSIIDELVGQVGPAMDRNYARWPKLQPQPGGHAAEIAILKQFLRDRTAWISAQLQGGLELGP